MIEQLITLKTAILAREKGFDEITSEVSYIKAELDVEEYYGCRNSQIRNKNYLTIPTQSLLQKWLRDNHNIDITIHRSFSMKNSYHYCIIRNNDYDNELQQEVRKDRKYEEALEEALYKALQLI